MDQLSTDQQEILRKSNTERLKLMAARTGMVDDDAIDKMDRAELMQVVAQNMVDKRDQQEDEKGVSSRKEFDRSDQVRELELQIELKRMELEAEARRIEAENRRIEAENERRRMEMENRRIEIENEREGRRMTMEMEMENAREKRAHELRMAQLDRPVGDETADSGDYAEHEDRGERRRPRVETLAERVKRYGSALKQVVAPMTNDPTEIPQFFESLEAMFRSFEVPDDLQAKLLLPFLSQKAKSLISRLSSDELDNYGNVKDHILSEFKLTPREYKARFDNATKQSDETHIYFVARLRNCLRYYLRSRQCEDFDKLCELLIVDKLKACLPSGPLNYVLSLEGDEWFTSKRVALLADTYVSNHPQRG